LRRGNAVSETLIGSLPGLNGVDFRPLAALARQGLPPIFAMHGLSLDDRRLSLGSPLNAGRLALQRDIFRLSALDGVKWIGAHAIAKALAAHGRDPVGATRVPAD
jgi:hypothetical protein